MSVYVGEQIDNNITLSTKEKFMINKSDIHEEDENNCHIIAHPSYKKSEMIHVLRDITNIV